jgi:hypothetical protein
MSIATTPRLRQAIALAAMISFSSRLKARSRHKINPARTCGYSSTARSIPRTAAAMMWSRSCSPPRLRFIGLKRNSMRVMLLLR